MYVFQFKIMVTNKPWELDYPTSVYKFRLPWNQYGSEEGIPIEFAKTLWKNLFPMWVHHTLHLPSFEVFRTPNMGLGLRSKINSTLSAMACEVHGFLEYITEEEEAKTGVFRVLTEGKYPSLFWGSNADLLLKNAILYGPLSLCNSNEFIPVRDDSFTSAMVSSISSLLSACSSAISCSRNIILVMVGTA